MNLVCQTLGINKSSYYNRKNNPKTDKEADDEALKSKMTEIFMKNKEEYGRVRMRKAMEEEGYPMSEGKIGRLMREENLVPKRSRKHKQTTNSKHSYPVADNILDRDFEAQEPNQKWCGDSTYVGTDEGWLYAAGILDLCGRICVGLSFSDRHTQELMLDCYDQACKKYRPKPGCIFHSDRGVQYASNAYKDALKKKGMIQSMSRSGVPYDNAPMESFWSTVKIGCVYGKRFRTKEEAKKAIFQYVFGFYNTRRYHTSNGLETPVEYYEKRCGVA